MIIGFIVLLIASRGIEYFRPKSSRLQTLRCGFLTDVAYWLFTPVVTRAVTRIGLVVVAIPLALLIYGQVDKEQIERDFGPAASLPLWLQAILLLTLADFLGYWMHRWFHGDRMWKFHAVHHSSVELDWLSSVRLHPVNDLLMRLATVIPVLALGFAPMDVGWDWGPLRWAIVSPRF